jgi:hypothetical protein
MKKERYVKLNSVGCWFDLKTGYTFPINKGSKDGNREGDEVVSDIYGTAVHVKNCSYEWIESLKGFDKTIVGVWFKNN